MHFFFKLFFLSDFKELLIDRLWLWNRGSRFSVLCDPVCHFTVIDCFNNARDSELIPLSHEETRSVIALSLFVAQPAVSQTLMLM